MSSVKDILKGSLTYSVVPICTALLTLLVIPFVSYVYPADEYGKINLFYTVGSLGVSTFLLGFDYYLMRNYYDCDGGCTPKVLFMLSLTVGISVDILVSLIVFLFFRSVTSQVLFGADDSASLVMLAIYIACLIAFRLLNLMARMSGNAARFNIQSVIQNIITRASFVLIAWYSTSYQWALLVMTVGMVLVTFYFMFRQRHECFQSVSWAAFGPLARTGFYFGAPCMLDVMASQLSSSIGKIILSGYGLFDAVGVLAVATTLSTAFSMIPQAFGTYWAPFMYKNYKTEQRLIRTVHDLVMLLSVVLIVAIFALQDILFCFVGQSYKAGQPIFMLLMLVPVRSFICETTSYGIMLENKPVFGSAITVCGVVLCAVVALWLVPPLGVNAVGIAVALSTLLTGVMRSVIGCRFYRSVNSWGRTAVGVVLIVAVCVSNFFVYQSLAARFLLSGSVLLIACFLYRKQIAHGLEKLRQLHA